MVGVCLSEHCFREGAAKEKGLSHCSDSKSLYTVSDLKSSFWEIWEYESHTKSQPRSTTWRDQGNSWSPREGLVWAPPSLQLPHDLRKGTAGFSCVSLRVLGDVGLGSS